MPPAAPNPTANPPVRRWLSRAWSATCQHIAGPPRVATYAFGKHPAFADFLDVNRLPPVPRPFRHFHDALRSAVERDGGPAGPILLAWRERGESAVLWVVPSRDRGDAVTGRFRHCPLLLGATSSVALADMIVFAGRLVNLAAGVAAADDVFERIGAASAEWATVDPRFAEPPGELPFAAVAVPDWDSAVVVVGEGDRVAERVAISTVSPATLGEWLAAAGPPRKSPAI